jgi:type IV secretory pathway VirB2 component (pilin)
MNISPSLLDPPGSSAFVTATEWMTGTLLGTVAVSLCVVAVAFVGLMMMTGRFAVRDGLRVVIGCFVLLGASTIAAGLRGAANEAYSAQPGVVIVQSLPEPPPLPQSTYDPYAGASLRQD